MNEVERLVGLCRVWGAADLFHPWLADNRIDWDQALLDTIPMIREATDEAAYRAGLQHLLDHLQDPLSHVYVEPEEAHSREAGPASRVVDGTLTVRPSQLSAGYVDALTEIAEIAKVAEGTSRVVLDVRESGSWSWLAPKLIEPLLNEPIESAPYRGRLHSGFPPETGFSSGGYHTGWSVRSGQQLGPRRARQGSKRVVVITDGRADADMVAALRSAGIAHVIHVGPIVDGGTRAFVDAGGGVHVSLRDEELAVEDLPPDVTLEGDASQSQIEQAVRVLLEGPPPAPRPLTARTFPTARSRREHGATSVEQRLLGGFRLWNVIRYFFPYHHTLDEPWGNALPAAIPHLVTADDELAYAMALLTMARYAQDSHVRVNSTALTNHLGDHAPPVLVAEVEGETIITKVGSEARAAGAAVGNQVLSVDGELVADRRARMESVVVASTPQALSWRVHHRLLHGGKSTAARVIVRSADGTERELTLDRSVDTTVAQPWSDDEPLPAYGVLPQGSGYIDLTRLTYGDVDVAMKTIWDEPSLILDMRGYPNGTAWPLAPYLARAHAPAAKFRRPHRTSWSDDHSAEQVMTQWVAPGEQGTYAGRVAMLIDARAISQAEHTCLFMAAATDVLFVGSATNGANGDVTVVALPGKVSVSFSGHDVSWPDGRQLQRVGVQPHLEVHPTIEGIRAGRDEVLEAALRALQAV
jgi:C-terminal processing protease CtpA/Prc